MAHQGEAPSNDRILRRREVERRVGLSRSAIYRRIARTHFPGRYRSATAKPSAGLRARCDAFLVAVRGAARSRRRNEGRKRLRPDPWKRQGRGAITKTLDASVPHDAQAGKAVAVWLYCIGARSIGETQVAFGRHPEWRAA